METADGLPRPGAPRHPGHAAVALERQDPAGFSCAELEGDAILESETILLLAFFGREKSELARRLAHYLLQRQLPEGGWARSPGGQPEISGSVKGYFALKLTGHDPRSEPLGSGHERAILALGGADRGKQLHPLLPSRCWARFPTSFARPSRRRSCSSPRWFPVNLYAISAWSRTIVVPLSIGVGRRSRSAACGPEEGIRELFLSEPGPLAAFAVPGPARPQGGLWDWERFFHATPTRQ